MNVRVSLDGRGGEIKKSYKRGSHIEFRLIWRIKPRKEDRLKMKFLLISLALFAILATMCSAEPKTMEGMILTNFG